ncbi:MAG: helicase [Proteobacteria bacterium]|nr:helicase [Pseudomonadota bacterium]
MPAPPTESRVKAVLGPTNTGKTHLAIERLCAHSSGMIGFPLRLLAREVYDRVRAIKGDSRVALITGEERIEPKDARWLLCTAEAMPVQSGRPGRPAEGPIDRDLAFVALDEAQLGADRERGHVFTDRLLHARGREETMILGSATIEPLVKKLVPGVEVIGRPRFSTLRHAPAVKLSRLPPRSAVVAFSAEQVYAVAEMLRRFRGGAAVVMGAMSPQTRNAQVALYQAGEVDYLVATDAIGMGLNLDVHHVAFAGLAKFDGQRQRRLTAAEMAQIAGRAGRHQRDGSFGVLGGLRGTADPEFSDEEVYAIEEHRFAPLTRLFWREAEPRFDSLATLIADLEAPPDSPELAPAPEAIDLAVLKRLADEPEIAASLTGPALVRRFWQACSLPDFRQQGVEHHARFVARLWQELARGLLGSDHAPQAIARLDNVQGDIDTLQGRIAAIRSWAYIAQRPDWVPAREEMAARARAVEARLSDALHARLTERFVHRRTAVLMRQLGKDAGLLPVALDGDAVQVDGEVIGQLGGLRFVPDPAARAAEGKLLLAAAERHVPALLAARAMAMAAAPEHLALNAGVLAWQGVALARLGRGKALLAPRLEWDAAVARIPAPARTALEEAAAGWLQRRLKALAPLARLAGAAADLATGPDLRALLLRLVDGGGIAERHGSGLERLDPARRQGLRRLGVRVGALDLFVPAMLRAGPLGLWRQLAMAQGNRAAPVAPQMQPVLDHGPGPVPAGYRPLGRALCRVDRAEDLLRAAHGARVAARGRAFAIDPAPALALGLSTAALTRLLRQAGFSPLPPRPLAEGAYGPPAPLLWRWRPPQPVPAESRPRPPATGAFAALAELVG